MLKRKTFYLLVSCYFCLTSCTKHNSLSMIKSNDEVIQSIISPINTQNSNKNSKFENATIQKTDDENSMQIYQKFLNGDISADDIDISYITIPTGEPNKRYSTKYAFFDSNGDKMPELHINSGRYYYILTYNNNKLKIWKNLSPYPNYYALNTGAFISHYFGAGPKSDVYNYYIFNYTGDEILLINFSKFDSNMNGIYDENDTFVFDGVNVTKEVWESLTERYLYVDDLEIEQIKNEIIWTVLYN